ncbi:MAG: hypothetical protein EBT08_09980, partial [Betaproteobacteria bacterium]|nr:hypothetical protein [Betaproteobacteria bacterium]
MKGPLMSLRVFSRIWSSVLTALLLAGSGTVFANSDVVRSAVESWLKGMKVAVAVEGVQKTPIAGLFEVRLGSELIYVDEKGRYGLVDGRLIDLKSNRNITQER